MNDETRNEIVRLARKGWTSSQICTFLASESVTLNKPELTVTLEHVCEVIDETDREMEAEIQATQATVTEPTLEQLQEQARQLFDQAYKLAEKAKALVVPTEGEWEEAWHMVNENMRDCSMDYPDTVTADGLWDVIDQVLEIRRETEEEKDNQSA